MSIIKTDSWIEVYRNRAKSGDINELSGRTHRSDITQFVNSEIASKMEIESGDIVVDIGCGDGTLMQLLEMKGASGFGILPTSDEVERVQARFSEPGTEIRIEKGLATNTNLPSNMANKVVCNGVFNLLGANDVDLALKEIARISKNNALIYIGEVPFCNEMDGKNYGDSLIKWLFWVLKNHGINQFLIRVIQTLKAVFSKEHLIIKPKGFYYCTPDNFISKAKSYGLINKDTFRHKSISPKKETVESDSRQDYMFYVEHCSA